MTAPKLEGTFHLDGLIEGPLFSDDDEQIIRRFIQEARTNGITFHLSIDGGRFSILPDTQPIKLPAAAVSADSTISTCIENWLANYSPPEHSQLMSTLRSVEYLPNRERQTLYAIHPAGTVSVEQRTVETETIAPAPPLDKKAILKNAAFFLMTLCVIIAISAIFVPYRDILGRFWQNVKPYNAEQLQINADTYADFFSIDTAEYDKETRLIKITCTTLEKFPITTQQLNQAWKKTDNSLPDKLAIESLARGYLLCEFFDAEDKFITHRSCRINYDPEKANSFYIHIPYNRLIHRVIIK
jgi:hypothetical protein